ncbi:MAG: RNA-binding protein [Candidatus Shapirobacteria bacterium]|jgi:RNA recognition motif-containing protein
MDQKHSPNKRLFIGSLPYRFTEGELLDLFVPFGKIISLKIMHNRWGKSRGMGFIEFDTLESAVAAKEKMSRYKLGDLAIIVDYAEPDPFLTPEGQANYEAGQLRHPKKQIVSVPRSHFNEDKKAPETELKEKRIRDFNIAHKFEHQRKSVFESRFHHAKTGAKFAARNKNK